MSEEHEVDYSEGDLLDEDDDDQSHDNNDKLDFMNSMGLLGVSQPVRSVPPPPISKYFTEKRQLASFTNNWRIPLSCHRGQELLKKLDQNVEYKYPPAYEEHCQPHHGIIKKKKKKVTSLPEPVRRRLRRRVKVKRQLFKESDDDEEFPVVTKRFIVKEHGLNPHIYSMGRRQRLQRYQELVIGVAKTCWKTLNLVKKSKLTLRKMKKAPKKTVKVSSLHKSSYLERKWRAAINFPCIRLVDMEKHAEAEDILQYLGSKRRPGSNRIQSKIVDSKRSRNEEAKYQSAAAKAKMEKFPGPLIVLQDLETSLSPEDIRQHLPKRFMNLTPKLYLLDRKLRSPTCVPLKDCQKTR